MKKKLWQRVIMCKLSVFECWYKCAKWRVRVLNLPNPHLLAEVDKYVSPPTTQYRCGYSLTSRTSEVNVSEKCPKLILDCGIETIVGRASLFTQVYTERGICGICGITWGIGSHKIWPAVTSHDGVRVIVHNC